MRLPRPHRPVLRRPRAWTLRARLLAATSGLLVVLCVVIATVTALSLHGYLVDRLDGQLLAATSRSTTSSNDHDADNTGPGGNRGAGFVNAPGQAAGTLGARIAGGQVTASVLDESGAAQTLSGRDLDQLAVVPAGGHPYTVDLGLRGSYRIIATTSADSDVLLTGLPLDGVTRTVTRLVAVEVAVSLVALALALLAGTVIVARTLRPLERVADTATRVVTLPLDRGEVDLAERVSVADTDPRTEVGRVGSSLNALLDRVAAALAARQASETRVRQFVADASHELRTPLASIRGYAELTRATRADASPELRHAMERVDSEAVRMSALVEDLLLLARLDASTDGTTGPALADDPVDLTRVVLDAVSDARAAHPGHSWRLELPEDPVVVDGDQHALHQVLANLLTNAATHTPAGTTVTTSLATTSPARTGTVELAVLDDGPGIADELLPTVFARFVMGRAGRGSGAGSTGLGLAIVRASAEAHGGEVEVTSRPGRTRFTVTLPAPA